MKKRLTCKDIIIDFITNKDEYIEGEKGFYYFEITRVTDSPLEVTLKHGPNKEYTTTVAPPREPEWTQTDRYYFVAKLGMSIKVDVEAIEAKEFIEIVGVMDWCGYNICYPKPSTDPDKPTPLHFKKLHTADWEIRVRFWLENIQNIQGVNIIPETKDSKYGHKTCGKTGIRNPKNNKIYSIKLKCYNLYYPGDNFAVRVSVRGWKGIVYSPWYYFKVVGWP